MFIYSKAKRIIADAGKIVAILMAGIILIIGINACKDKKEPPAKQGRIETKKWDFKSENFDFALAQAELQLAGLKKPYLVLDFSKNKLILKLNGVAVWDVPMEITADESDSPEDFTERFFSDNNLLVRPLFDKHLFAGKGQSSDSVLKIISGVVRASVELMQREVPERFQLEWENGLLIEFRTEIMGQPKSKFKNTLVELRRTLQRPFGESAMVVRLDSKHAITLYRVAERGLPTLIYPPKYGGILENITPSKEANQKLERKASRK
jgi:hypothetical protein